MNRLLYVLAASHVIASFACAATADTKQSARDVFRKQHDKVFGVKAILKVEISIQGKPAGTRDAPVWTNGAVVEDGIVLVSYRAIRPQVSATLRGREGVTVKTNIEEVQLVDAAGEEFDARLVLHDEDLGIAFIALDRDAGNAETWSADAIDLTTDVELSHLDEAVVISRASESMRFQPTVRVGYVDTVVPRPRLFYRVSNLSSGAPVFNLDGQFVGLSIRRSAAAGQSDFRVVLPAKYIRKLLPQAIEKAANASDDDTGGDQTNEDIGEAEKEDVRESSGESNGESSGEDS